jgi:hypothetical protein
MMSNKRPANRVPLPEIKDDGPSWVPIFVLFIIPAYPVTQLVGLGLLIARMHAKHNRKQLERMRHIINILGNKPYVSLRAITKATGRSRGDVTKTINEMIAKGYLGSEAYIDHSKNMLIVERAYEQQAQDENSSFGMHVDFDFEEFKNIASDIARTIKNSFQSEYVGDNEEEPQEASYEKVEPEAEKPAAEAEPKNARKGHQEILDKLQLLNDQILDENVSGRIDRIAQLTDNIYDVVDKNPDRANEVRKFMNYYLPTTIKLLGSYGMLERQSYQGENIVAARRNIEDILDTLVHAFEKQLDRLFAAEAVDISSDIQVLETMIAKDGLTQQAMRLKL